MRGLDNNKPLFKALKEGELNCFLEEVRNNKEYFLGIRNEYINIYYMGGNLLRITSDGKNKGKFKFEFNEKYYGNSKESLLGKNESEQWLKVMPKLKSYIKKYQEGENPVGRKKNEKIAQQYILNNINSSKDSDYFITDMEYCCPGIGYGRFDYVAIKKKKDSKGKHRLALIELKYGTAAFGSSYKEKKGSYGSGIVGHAHNLSRFVYGIEECDSFKREKIDKTEYETLEYLRKETVNILKSKCELNLLDNETYRIFSDIKESDIDIEENNIETLLLCLGCEDENKSKASISKYLGVTKGAKYNIKELKNSGEIASAFKMKCFVTKESSLDCLYEDQFEVI